MGLLDRFFGRRSNDYVRIANGIIARHLHRVRSGECRTYDKLFLELRQIMPQAAAETVHSNYRRCVARSNPQAERLLILEICAELQRQAHDNRTFPSLWAKGKERIKATFTGPASAQRTYAKALAGEPITGEDEDAVIFGDLMNNND